MSETKYSQRKIGFIQGVIYAAALMTKYQMDADGLLKESNLSVTDIRKYADDHDIELLKDILEDLE